VPVVPLCVLSAYYKENVTFLSSWVVSENKHLTYLVNVRGAVSGSPIA
jgi:hypothetical protein